MEMKLDLSREYGIVLEGGGARGSYQIGAWRALREAGLNIKGISGASVGALNGALMCMDDLEKAEYIWEHISYSKVIDIQDELAEQVVKKNFKELNIKSLIDDLKKVLSDGGFDITPLKQLINDTLDEHALRTAVRELFITTYSLSDRRQLTIDVKTVPEGEIADMLLASAYFPVFKSEKLGGKRYIDGGGLNNVPLDALLEQDYKDIIIIRIYGLGYDSEKRAVIPADVNIYHIAPRQDLGGILEFDVRRAKKNMRLGYYDALRLLYGLEGKRYYIYAPESEAYYFRRMMSAPELLEHYLLFRLSMPEMDFTGGYRIYTETVFPKLAKALKLKDSWDYKTLYLAILEEQVRKLRLNRFKIYTVAELQKIICQKARDLDSPLFV